MSRQRHAFWILDGHTPVPEPDARAWAEFMQQARRHIGLDRIEQAECDPVDVSTVFLGLDHNWTCNGPPLLFETLVIGGPLDQEMYRYATWQEAERGHRIVVDEVTNEARVVAWEVREKLRAISHKATAGGDHER